MKVTFFGARHRHFFVTERREIFFFRAVTFPGLELPGLVVTTDPPSTTVNPFVFGFHSRPVTFVHGSRFTGTTHMLSFFFLTLKIFVLLVRGPSS